MRRPPTPTAPDQDEQTLTREVPESTVTELDAADLQMLAPAPVCSEVTASISGFLDAPEAAKAMPIPRPPPPPSAPPPVSHSRLRAARAYTPPPPSDGQGTTPACPHPVPSSPRRASLPRPTPPPASATLPPVTPPPSTPGAPLPPLTPPPPAPSAALPPLTPPPEPPRAKLPPPSSPPVSIPQLLPPPAFPPAPIQSRAVVTPSEPPRQAKKTSQPPPSRISSASEPPSVSAAPARAAKEVPSPHAFYSPGQRTDGTRVLSAQPMAPSYPPVVSPTKVARRPSLRSPSSVTSILAHARRSSLLRKPHVPVALGGLAGFVLFLGVWLLARPSPAVAVPAQPPTETVRAEPAAAAPAATPAPLRAAPVLPPQPTYAPPAPAQPVYAPPPQQLAHTPHAGYRCTHPSCPAPAYVFPQPTVAAPDQLPISPGQLPTFAPAQVAAPAAEPAAAPKSAPRRARQAVGQATVNLNSIPVSNVVLDGRPLGSTPITGVRVRPGSHSVTFIHPTLGRRQTTIFVGPGQKKAAFARFSTNDE